MGKFSGLQTAAPTGVANTVDLTRTAEGGTGYNQDSKTELYTLAVTNMVSEATFYEGAEVRDNRFVSLVHEVTKLDPEWVRKFGPWLRSTANMRSASVVLAVEYVRAGGEFGRELIAAVCQRGDEPSEVLGYYLSHYGKNVPWAVKQGLSDACARLYTQRNFLKYDSANDTVRMADVLELCHCKPASIQQSALYKHIIDYRHKRPHDVLALESAGLADLSYAYRYADIGENERRGFLKHATLPSIWDWEKLSGWIPMDAEAWEVVIPQMGYMALLRNLRNFEEKGVSSEVLDKVAAKIADPGEVANSRQFPYRFWSAYKQAGLRFAWPLEQAVQHSLSNIPRLSGRTLIMVDVSGSMDYTMSVKSDIMRYEIGGLFGAGLQVACEHSDMFTYTTAYTTNDMRGHGVRTTAVPKNPSILRTVEEIRKSIGGGTPTWDATKRCFSGHDRVIIITDEQAHPSSYDANSAVPTSVPLYVWNIAGDKESSLRTGPGRYLFGGFSDKAFEMASRLEAGLNGRWPWMVEQ